MYTYVCVYICIHIYVYMYTYICVYIHMYMYTYMCMLWIYCVHTTYIYTHKWIHCVYTRHRESAWERDRLRHNTCLHTSVDRGRQRERERDRECSQGKRMLKADMNMCVCSFGPRYWRETPPTMLWGKAKNKVSFATCYWIVQAAIEYKNSFAIFFVEEKKNVRSHRDF